jgi:Arc/MetJ-type ribon-helix-helix transcriptional regulator
VATCPDEDPGRDFADRSVKIVDTLISAGIAPNRAEAIRWSLARISERPAYAQLRERTREIEQLKSEF